jgi:hypothetical protein
MVYHSYLYVYHIYNSSVRFVSVEEKSHLRANKKKISTVGLFGNARMFFNPTYIIVYVWEEEIECVCVIQVVLKSGFISGYYEKEEKNYSTRLSARTKVHDAKLQYLRFVCTFFVLR